MPEKSKVKTIKRYEMTKAEHPPEYSLEVVCPKCGRRAFDLSNIPKGPLWVGLKCPHCQRIIHLECEGLKPCNSS